MGTKQNPGRFDCYNAAAGDEPIFVLRSTDWTGSALVRVWADLYKVRKQAEGEWGAKQIEKHHEALRVADEMDNWRENETRIIPTQVSDNTKEKSE